MAARRNQATTTSQAELRTQVCIIFLVPTWTFPRDIETANPTHPARSAGPAKDLQAQGALQNKVVVDSLMAHSASKLGHQRFAIRRDGCGGSAPQIVNVCPMLAVSRICAAAVLQFAKEDKESPKRPGVHGIDVNRIGCRSLIPLLSYGAATPGRQATAYLPSGGPNEQDRARNRHILKRGHPGAPVASPDTRVVEPVKRRTWAEMLGPLANCTGAHAAPGAIHHDFLRQGLEVGWKETKAAIWDTAVERWAVEIFDVFSELHQQLGSREPLIFGPREVTASAATGLDGIE
ncbi:hypothetical protein P170DRAFT_245696 [Aspergillus steynii IBT 23096]|uniref:Uncharacterized protein n=1 Tax=Aspergillus steynii IBT 23096 TaxID=1392250 RepID=A0A2I2FY12_9EURO|nr:uncharacterized protein P170DRAFT_245696 [Aspergillus steynii IBT 23096]PLB45520.1 hypothetical protein P170DRAFT_245696 [Aspergillus steynii IBT 23096]